MRTSYFGPLLQEVAKIGGNESTLSLYVTDDRGDVHAGSGPPSQDSDDLQRTFPLLFMNRAVVATTVSLSPAIPELAIHARANPDNALMAAVEGTRRTFALITVAGLASIVALVVTVRAARAHEQVATMKSDFVAAVTHELKTPLALMWLVADTLLQRRYSSPDTVQEYAQLLSKEVQRLGRSIDNLLTFARYTGAISKPLADLTPADLGSLVEEAFDPFRPILAERGFELNVDVPRELPRVHADSNAVVKAMEAVIDNAIKYSGASRCLECVATVTGRHVVMTFRDHGIGIPRDDAERVTSRFFRARNAVGDGSGLGLAIARRILSSHHGNVVVRSAVGIGTEVDLVFAAVEEP